VEFTEQLFGLIIAHGGGDNHVITWLPVGWSHNFTSVGELERVDDANKFIKVATAARRVGENESDLVVGINHKDRTHCQRKARSIQIGLIQHVVQLGNLAIRICEDGIVDSHLVDLIDVLHPARVAVRSVNAETNQFHVALFEFGLLALQLTKFSRANGSEILGVGEQDSPRVRLVVVEVEITYGRLAGEIRCDIADAERGRSCHYLSKREDG